jgi:hypothetical protein
MPAPGTARAFAQLPISSWLEQVRVALGDDAIAVGNAVACTGRD